MPKRPATARDSIDIAQAIQQAFAFHQQGRLAEAEELYTAVLRAKPNQVDALHLLGLAKYQRGDHTEAQRLIRASLVLKPNSADALANYGLVLQALGRNHEALTSYNRALAIKPDDVEVYFNLGNVFLALGRNEEALASFDKSLAFKPDSAETHYNRSIALQALERYEEALASLDRVLALAPGHADALNNRGNVLGKLGRHEEALASYDRSLTLKPDFAEAHNNRGNAQQSLNAYEQALASYERALELKPDYAEALCNRGNALQALNRHAAALASYDSALSLMPDYADAVAYRGDALHALKRIDEALACYDRALAIKPDDPNHINRIAVSALAICDWKRVEKVARKLPAQILEGKPCVTPFVLLAVSDDPSLHLRCAKKFLEEHISVRPLALWNGTKYRHQKIRIAYVSADFHQHATSYLMAELFELHDRSRFEVLGISIGHDDHSDMRRRLVQAFDQFHNVRNMSDHDVAKLLSDLEVDIAVDLKGFTQDSRIKIFTHRPAPIQVSYLGYPGTMGADFIDYIIADKVVAPFEHQPFYSEKIVHLPDCYQVNDSKRRIADNIPTRREVGLPDDGFIFCSFNNNFKITEQFFDVWIRLLKAVDGSILWLLRDNAGAEQNLRHAAESRKVDPDRLIFADRVTLEEHLARFSLADLFLDTLPYNAHTTASDALWAGVPVLTCQGTAFAGRVGASLLYAIGLPELITTRLEDYERLAVKLATNRPALQTVRQKLVENRVTCPLFNTDRFRRNIEKAYITMWEQWQTGKARSFSVAPD